MLELFKRRNFGDYVSDTFHFFKVTGKHYLKNYFTISGILLMVLVVASYFLFDVFIDFSIKSGNDTENFKYLENYMNNNAIVVVLAAVGLFLFIVLLSMLNYAIPVIYFDLYEKNNGNNFSTKEILNQFKAKFGKILIFFLGTLFFITPFLCILFGILLLLCFIIIGIPLLLFAFPTVFSWITLSFYEYLNNDKGFFHSFGAGFKHVRKQYFPIVGSVMVVYIIIQVSMSFFSLVPYIIGIISMVTETQNPTEGGDPYSTFRIMMVLVLVLTILMSFILNNLLMINQGLVFYSRQEFDENKSADQSIDLIGSE